MALCHVRSGTGKLATALFALTLVLTACGGDDGPSSSSGGRQTVNVAVLSLADTAPFYIARDKGLFAKEGLNVRVQPVQQSIQALPALAKGQVDMIAGGNYVTFLQAHEKGTLDLRIVADGARASSHMMDVLVPKDSGIKSVSDLKGRTVGVNILNNIQSLTLNAILDARGAGRPVYRQIAFPQMGPSLEKDQVDAVHAAEPFDSAIQKDLHARVLLDGAASPVQGMPLGGYITTRAYAAKHRSAALAFRRAISAASKLATQDPALVRKELPSYTKVTADQAASIHLPAYATSTDVAQLRRLTELMTKQGLLSKDIDPATLLVK
jgi:NitT/TauT family transport system substrate-binding protein